MKLGTAILLLIFIILASTAASKNNHLQTLAQEASSISWAEMQQRILADRQATQNNALATAPISFTPCWNDMAGDYPCEKIDLLSLVPLNKMDANDGNDIWGWTDQTSGREFALMGLDNGVAFVDISEPTNPHYLGKLPTHTANSIWRDVKVYQDYAFVVSEASGHGLQIFDLKQLLNVVNPPVTFVETGHYDQFGGAHNIAINEDSGYAYVVGAYPSCSGGLHMINIQDPTNPTFAGCFSQDGYTHDAQCVIYHGPDTNYQGNEVCFNSNEDTLTIADVTDKNNPVQLARKGYSGAAYTHQGWLTEDHTYFLLGDEGDQSNYEFTRTYIWDVSDLSNPIVIGIYTATVSAIDHNLYIHNGLVYEANYRSGLRILDAALIPDGTLAEVAFFDTYPPSDSASYNGAWSVYPFFDSGNIIVSDIEKGLFVLRYPSQELQLNFLPMIRNSN